LKLNRRTLIISASTIIFFTILGSLFINYWQYQQNILENFQNCDDDDGCLRIYGNIVSEYYIGITDLKNGTFDRIENISYYQLNMYNNSVEYSISGVKLWDIFNVTGIFASGVEYFRFESTDGYVTYNLPIQFLLENPDAVIIVTQIDGEDIPPKAEGGDGPLESAIFLEPLLESEEVQEIFEDNNQDFVHNSKFSVKYFNMIHLF
jgi:hypothetical protein